MLKCQLCYQLQVKSLHDVVKAPRNIVHFATVSWISSAKLEPAEIVWEVGVVTSGMFHAPRNTATANSRNFGKHNFPFTALAGVMACFRFLDKQTAHIQTFGEHLITNYCTGELCSKTTCLQMIMIVLNYRNRSAQDSPSNSDPLQRYGTAFLRPRMDEWRT